MILGFVFIIVLAFAVFFTAVCLLLWGKARKSQKQVFAGGILVAVLILFCIGGGYWLTQTTEGVRLLKDYDISTSGGVPRVISLYTPDGVIIKQYEGVFDVVQGTGYIVFNERDSGAKTIIYYASGSIVVDEMLAP